MVIDAPLPMSSPRVILRTLLDYTSARSPMQSHHPPPLPPILRPHQLQHRESHPLLLKSPPLPLLLHPSLPQAQSRIHLLHPHPLPPPLPELSHPVPAPLLSLPQAPPLLKLQLPSHRTLLLSHLTQLPNPITQHLSRNPNIPRTTLPPPLPLGPSLNTPRMIPRTTAHGGTSIGTATMVRLNVTSPRSRTFFTRSRASSRGSSGRSSSRRLPRPRSGFEYLVE